MSGSLPTFSQKRLAGLVAILSFGLTALFAVLGLGNLVPAMFVTGFFIILPLIVLLGEDFPLVEASGDEKNRQPLTSSAEDTPIATLKRRYADGEIDEAEFEYKLEQILEAEQTAQEPGQQTSTTTDAKLRELERDLEE